MSRKVDCFFINKCPPPSANFKNSVKNHVTQKCRVFVYKNVSQIVLLFAKCLAFCIVKRHVTQSVMIFVYICQLQTFHENSVTSSVLLFVYKNVTEIVYLFEKCLAFCI